MSWPGISFRDTHEELGFLRAFAQVTRVADALLEDCMQQGLGLEAALDVFLTHCGRLIGATDGFVEIRGTRGAVLTRRIGVRWLEPKRFPTPGPHPHDGGTVLLKLLDLGTLQLGSFGLRVEGLDAGDSEKAMALVEAMGEQLDGALLAFVAIAEGASPAQRLDELAAGEQFRPRMRVGRYELLVPLGSGGMAQVFVARQIGPEGVGRLVALKRILPHLADEKDVVDHFLDEAQIGLRLSHPNLPAVFDFGKTPAGYYLAMELVRGASLYSLLAQHGPLAPELAVGVLVQALRGLHSAHELRDEDGQPLQLVHRDLSPHNLMIGFDGVVKVLDFGIARTRRQRTHTEIGETKGKALYMSPEQALGKRLDRRSDVFSAGVVLYEALTGERPFKRNNEAMTMEAVVSVELTRDARIPKRLWAPMARATSKECTERWPDAQAFADALAKAIAPAGEAELGALVRATFPEAHTASLGWDSAAQRGSVDGPRREGPTR